MTDFLTSWQGVSATAAVCASLIAVLIILIKNIDAIKGLRVSKDGVRFDGVDLSAAIPRIDSQVKVRLQSVVKDIVERARASVDISEFAYQCGSSCAPCGSSDTRVRALKMLLVQTMLTPLYDSITRNHLVRALSSDRLNEWIKQILSEIHGSTLVIEDYCGIDLPDAPLMASIEQILREFYIPRARAILLEGVYNKLDVYNKLSDSDKRKARLLDKCHVYIDGLD